jgi:hypothetical protein
MASNQTYANWRSVLESVAYPSTVVATQEIFKGSALLSRLASISADGKSMPKVKDTFTGRFERVSVNKYEYMTSEAELNDFAIKYGDDVQGKQGKDLTFATFDAFDIGSSVYWTDEDRQEIAQQRGRGLANWMQDSMEQSAGFLRQYLFKEIISGTGTVVRNNDGSTRNSCVGLSTIVSEDTYGGLAYSADNSGGWRFWKGHNFDMNNDILNFTASSQFNSISALLGTAFTGGQVTVFYDFINKVRRQVPKKPGDKVILLMHPYVYDYLWLPAMEQQKITPFTVRTNDQMVELSDDGWMMREYEVVVERAELNNQYIMPIDEIYLLNLSDMKLKAETSKNLKWSEWEEVPGKHGAYYKKFEATMLFYAKRRWSQAKITLHDDLVTELRGISGNIIQY